MTRDSAWQQDLGSPFGIIKKKICLEARGEGIIKVLQNTPLWPILTSLRMVQIFPHTTPAKCAHNSTTAISKKESVDLKIVADPTGRSSHNIKGHCALMSRLWPTPPRDPLRGISREVRYSLLVTLAKYTKGSLYQAQEIRRPGIQGSLSMPHLSLRPPSVICDQGKWLPWYPKGLWSAHITNDKREIINYFKSERSTHDTANE